MSIQQEQLSAIADAIRSKEGSSEAIPAKAFAQRITNLPDPGPVPVSYKRETIGITADKFRGGGLIFTAGKKYAAMTILPSSQSLPPFAALLQKDGTYLAGYASSSGVHDPAPRILTVTGSEGSYRYTWIIDPDGVGLDYVGSTLACFYAE